MAKVAPVQAGATVHLSPTVITAIIGGACTVTAGALSVFSSHVVSKRTVKAQNVQAEASIQTAINGGFETLMKAAQGEREELRTEISGLREVVRKLIGHVESLEAILRDRGIPFPALPPFTMIEGGKKDAIS